MTEDEIIRQDPTLQRFIDNDDKFFGRSCASGDSGPSFHDLETEETPLLTTHRSNSIPFSTDNISDENHSEEKNTSRSCLRGNRSKRNPKVISEVHSEDPHVDISKPDYRSEWKGIYSSTESNCIASFRENVVEYDAQANDSFDILDFDAELSRKRKKEEKENLSEKMKESRKPFSFVNPPPTLSSLSNPPLSPKSNPTKQTVQDMTRKRSLSDTKVKPSFLTIQPEEEEEPLKEEPPSVTIQLLSMISSWDDSNVDTIKSLLSESVSQKDNQSTPIKKDALNFGGKQNANASKKELEDRLFEDYLNAPVLVPLSRDQILEPEEPEVPVTVSPLRNGLNSTQRNDKTSNLIKTSIVTSDLKVQEQKDGEHHDESNSRKRKLSLIEDRMENPKKRRLIKNIYSTRVPSEYLEPYSITKERETNFRLPRMPPKHRIDIGPIVLYLPEKEFLSLIVKVPLPHAPRLLPFSQLLSRYITLNYIPSDQLKIRTYGFLPNITKEMRSYHDQRYLNFLKRQSLKSLVQMRMKNDLLRSNTSFNDQDSFRFGDELDMDDSIYDYHDDISSEISGESSLDNHTANLQALHSRKSIYQQGNHHIQNFRPNKHHNHSNVIHTLRQNLTASEVTKEYTNREYDYDSDLFSEDSNSEEDNFVDGLSSYGINTDAPMFPLLWPHVKLITSGTLMATKHLLQKNDRVVVHFSGGRHHARKDRAAGYCYVNDIVLAAFLLTKRRKRVMIVDIDIHHGDGTQSAFYYSSQVMTISFHQYGKGLYPGTGSLDEIGEGKGKGYNVNVPLMDGISDANFMELFKVIVGRACEAFRPDYIIFVCGADALSRDRLGVGNLTTRTYEFCTLFLVDLLKRYHNMRLLVTGAGGYNLPDTVRVWNIVLATLCNGRLDSLPVEIPEFSSYDLFQPDYKLHTTAERVRDRNTPDYLSELRKFILDCLDQYNKPGTSDTNRK